MAAQMQLGEMLQERGWITHDQLHRALQAHRVGSVRLGSRLLEINALSEDLLLKALSEQLSVPAAGIDDLRNIPQEVVERIPSKLAVRCCAVPFRMVGSTLYVAMLEVHNLLLQDEIAFAAGKRIKIHIANEARIFEALDRYYYQECPSRFVRLLDHLNRSRYMWDDRAAPAQKPRRTNGQPKPGQAWSPRASPGVAEPSSWLNRFPLDTPPETLVPGHLRSQPVSGPAVGGPNGEGAAAALGGSPEAPPQAADAPTSRPAPRQPPKAIPLTDQDREDLELTSSLASPAAAPVDRDAARALCRERLEAARNREDIGRALVAYLGELFDRAALLVARKDGVEGWMGCGRGFNEIRLSEFRADFSQPSIFLNFQRGVSNYLGQLPPMPAHEEMLRCWSGTKEPVECAAVPVRLQGRLVMAIYGDRRTKSSPNVDLEQLRGLAEEAAAAFERCILRKKHRTP